MMNSNPILNDHRICSKCNILLPIENFSKDVSKSNGYRPACKRCASILYYIPNKTKMIARNKIRNKEYHKTLDYNYSKYKLSAKNRKIEFNLTKEEFSKSFGKKCHYCREEFNGYRWDRINSGLGYTPDNIVPCCYTCNIMKRDMSQGTFLQQCKKISDNIDKIIE